MMIILIPTSNSGSFIDSYKSNEKDLMKGNSPRSSYNTRLESNFNVARAKYYYSIFHHHYTAVRY